MNRLATRWRTSRAAARRTRAINRALAGVTSPSMREELLAIANRD